MWERMRQGCRVAPRCLVSERYNWEPNHSRFLQFSEHRPLQTQGPAGVRALSICPFASSPDRGFLLAPHPHSCFCLLPEDVREIMLLQVSGQAIYLLLQVLFLQRRGSLAPGPQGTAPCSFPRNLGTIPTSSASWM